METNKYIAAIDLGSTKITGALARKTPDGNIEILAQETLAAKYIRKGEIKNVDETAKQIKKIVERLNNCRDLQENGLEITTIYAALGGRSLDTALHTVKRWLGKEDKITEKLLTEMHRENYNLKFGEDEVFGVFEQEYLVDDEAEHAPVGMNCSNLQGRYVVIHGDPRLKFNLDNLQKIGDTHLVNEQFAPIVAARATLTEEDIEKGCAFIDFGAETTSVCIFFRGYLRHLFVLPFGGSMITQDFVENLNLTQADAEKMKIHFGNALAELEKERKIFIPSKNEGEAPAEFNTIFIAKAVEYQIDKTLSLIWQEINDAGLAKYLGAGVVIAGGAANLRNLDKHIELKTGCATRYAKFDGCNNAIIWGLLKTAKENCSNPVKKEEKVVITQPAPKKGFIRIIINGVCRLKKIVEESGTFFDENDEYINITDKEKLEAATIN
ncbi:MAG: rod shape-determining protein [Prevotellaceae bacterium]|jgi:cell division protein FtsA|nr:rod shape-determining protein [Prevotellaceae bacterium]